MSEMVERVAVAIRERMDQLLDDTTGEIIDTRHIARAAIEAMRDADIPFPEAIKEYWRAMIDEALK